MGVSSSGVGRCGLSVRIGHGLPGRHGGRQDVQDARPVPRPLRRAGGLHRGIFSGTAAYAVVVAAGRLERGSPSPSGRSWSSKASDVVCRSPAPRPLPETGRCGLGLPADRRETSSWFSGRPRPCGGLGNRGAGGSSIPPQTMPLQCACPVRPGWLLTATAGGLQGS